jgi:hypothetical protein
MGWKPLFPDGITPAQRSNVLVLHVDDTFRAARSLGELTADWAFFTIGCLYTYGGLDVDIMIEYTQIHPDKDCSVLTLLAERPIFAGMCTPSWPDRSRRLEQTLWATPLEYWPGLKDHLAGVSMVDRNKGRFARTTVQELEIVDFAAVARAVVASPRPPTLRITAFGIDGNKHHVGFVPRTTSVVDAARVVRLPVRPETVEVGRAILEHDPAPLMATLEHKPADPADVARKIDEAEEKIP